MPRISKKVMLNRLARLSEQSDTREVMDTLKLSRAVIDRWLKDKRFLAAQVAVCKNGKWVWNKFELTAWIQAVMNLAETKGYTYKRKRQSNPPPIEMNPDEIEQITGVKKGYRVKR